MVASLPGGNNVVDVRDVGRGIVTILQQGVREGNYLLSGWNLTFDQIIRTIAAEVGARPPRMILPAGLRPLLYWTFWLAESLNRRELDLSASDTDSAFRFRYFDNKSENDTFMDLPLYTGAFVPTEAFFETSEDDVLFKGNLSWKFSEDALFYATVSEGYRRGGSNAVPLDGAFAEDPGWQVYTADSVVNYEAGVKGNVAGVTYDLSLFYVEGAVQW